MYKLTALILILIFIFPTGRVFAATDVSTDPDLSTSLVSYWSLEEASGTRVDAHSTNDLADINTVTSASGKQGTAGDFEHTNTEYLSIEDNAALSLTGSQSYAMWVRFESVPGSGSAYTFVSKYSADTSRNMTFNLEDGNVARWVVQNSAGTFSVCDKAWEPSIDTWYHLAVTYNSAATEMKIYLDGAQLGTTCTSTVNNVGDGDGDFRIGYRDDAADVAFDGLIDEVGAWSKVLTADEVADLYNAGNGIPYEAPPPSEPNATSTRMFIGTGKQFIGNGALKLY